MRKDLIERLRREAAISARAGQLSRLNALADEFAVALESSVPVGVEGLMQLARNWCLAWGEWAHDADPGCAKENAAETALRAALTTALAQQPAPSAPVGVAEAWQQGYHQGVLDERTSEANIGIAGFDAKIEPARVNPYLAQQTAACPKCDGTGEADSGGIMPWGAPAMIPCDCKQPGAVDEALQPEDPITAYYTQQPVAPALVELVTTLAATGTVTG